MPSQQLELKSDITNLFKDLESIAKDTKVHAPHVPKIEQADITELFSGLNEAHEEAKIEVELRLSLEEKNEFVKLYFVELLPIDSIPKNGLFTLSLMRLNDVS